MFLFKAFLSILMLFNPCPCCSIGTILLSSSSSIISGINGISSRLGILNFKFNFFLFLKELSKY